MSDDASSLRQRLAGWARQLQPVVLALGLVARRAVGRFDSDVGGFILPATRYIETLPNGREHEIIEISDADQHDDTPVFVVPPRHYFMMGDNRDNSLDSRIAAAEGGVGF